jgi:hypothetical protein
MNSQGAAAIGWTVSGPPGSSSSVLAVVRPARGNLERSTTDGQRRIRCRRSCGNRRGWRGDRYVGNLQCHLQEMRLRAKQLRSACPQQKRASAHGLNAGRRWDLTGETHDARVALDSTGRAMLVALSSSGACLRVHRLLYIAGVCRQRFHQQQHLVASRRHIRQ